MNSVSLILENLSLPDWTVESSLRTHHFNSSITRRGEAAVVTLLTWEGEEVCTALSQAAAAKRLGQVLNFLLRKSRVTLVVSHPGISHAPPLRTLPVNRLLEELQDILQNQVGSQIVLADE